MRLMIREMQQLRTDGQCKPLPDTRVARSEVSVYCW